MQGLKEKQQGKWVSGLTGADRVNTRIGADRVHMCSIRGGGRQNVCYARNGQGAGRVQYKKKADCRVYTRREQASHIQGGDGQSVYKERAGRVYRGFIRKSRQSVHRGQTERIQGEGR